VITDAVSFRANYLPFFFSSSQPTISSAIKAVKEQLRALPHRGVGYGLLRYLNNTTAATLSALAKLEDASSDVSFNYLGVMSSTEGSLAPLLAPPFPSLQFLTIPFAFRVPHWKPH